MPERKTTDPVETLTCPTCGKTSVGTPSACPYCGSDLRGLGSLNDTLARTARQANAGLAVHAGEVVDKRYRLKERLGDGGMGSVWKVEHVRMGKVLALKLLRADLALDKVALKRFQQEARIVSRLSHPNTVSVFDFGELDAGGLYMAMEYVPGRDLAAVLAEEGALAPKRAVGLCIQVLRSLAEAHEAGIVHRDIKPANVMLVPTREGDELVKVVDFGIARLAEDARRAGDKGHVTGQADFVGTPHYMSPEQVRGEAPDARSDLYSVGALLFELVSGRPPFEGPTPLAIASKHLTDDPPLLHDAAPDQNVSAELESIVQRALEKDARRRFQTADEMRAALTNTRSPNSFIEPAGRGAGERPPTTDDLQIAQRSDWDDFERVLRRRRRIAPAAALLLLLVAGAAGWRALVAPPQAARLPVTEEVEPNDGPRTANLIEPGGTVQGFLRRSERDKADRDLFEFRVPGPNPALATVSVSGVPNVNVAVDLYALKADVPEGEAADSAALPNFAHVDDRFLGGAERMDDLALEPGRYLVRISDRRRPDESAGSPRENTMDPYALQIRLAPLQRFYETEPNNMPEQALPIGTARPIFGHAGGRGETSRVTTGRGEAAEVAGLWSDDYFLFERPTSNAVCALLSGVRGAVLELSPDPVIRTILGSPRGVKRVREGELGQLCFRGSSKAVIKVRVAEGESLEPYVLALVDESPDGFSGALAACDELVVQGRPEVCRELLAGVRQALPDAKGVRAAEEMLAEIGD